MAANPEIEQDLDVAEFEVNRNNTRLGTMAQVRTYMGSVIRRMDKGELELSKGKSLLRAAKELHGLIRDEVAPQSGTTNNLLMVTAELSPILQLARQFIASGSGGIPAHDVSNRPLALVDAGVGEDGLSASVAVPEMSGRPEES